jgi:rSAM/selenodomain-associated transferase 1
MYKGHEIAVVIPARNEEAAIGQVLAAIPDCAGRVVVADNGSTDRTSAVAREQGVRVIHEPRRGYGMACQAALAAVEAPDVVVFLDADFSDYPEEMVELIAPICRDDADLVIGSRTAGKAEKGALTPQARFGNRLACALMQCGWDVRYTDLGPFRAVRWTALRSLGMADRDFGWTVEMQIRAARAGLKNIEVPVRYRRRIGQSKISGTVSGVFRAGTKILTVLGMSLLRPPRIATGSAADTRLCLFTRWPEPGKAKTRLIPELGAAGAAALQRRMTENILATAKQWLAAAEDREIEVRFTGGALSRMQDWLGMDLPYRFQAEGDLGARMAAAMETAFREAVKKVLIIGTDCPGITPEILEEAETALEGNDIVIGPAEDGGYYLIGLAETGREKALPAVFRDIAWGTSRVFEESAAKIANAGLSLHLLPRLRDIDRPEDLAEIPGKYFA